VNCNVTAARSGELAQHFSNASCLFIYLIQAENKIRTTTMLYVSFSNSILFVYFVAVLYITVERNGYMNKRAIKLILTKKVT